MTLSNKPSSQQEINENKTDVIQAKEDTQTIIDETLAAANIQSKYFKERSAAANENYFQALKNKGYSIKELQNYISSGKSLQDIETSA